MSFIKRHLGASAAALLALVVTVGVAIAQTDGGEDSPPNAASLERVSEASRGKAGEKPPPCPAAELEDDLKQAGLPIGPCVPVPAGLSPEERQRFVDQYPPIEPKPAEEDTDSEAVNCPEVAISAGRGTVGSGRIHKQFPCGPGAKIIEEGDFEIREGRLCVPVTWKPNAAREPRTELVCAPNLPQ